MGVSKVASWSKPELCGVSISASRMELSKVMSSVWLGAHERAKGNRFRGNVGKDIKGMGGDDVREICWNNSARPEHRN